MLLVSGTFSLVMLSATTWSNLFWSHFADAKNPGSAGKRDSGPGVADSKASFLYKAGAQETQRIKVTSFFLEFTLPLVSQLSTSKIKYYLGDFFFFHVGGEKILL